MTTKDEIRKWLTVGKENGCTHVIVVCDTFDHEDFPVYVPPGEDVTARISEYNDHRSMSRVMEVYAMHLDLESQLAEQRSYHVEGAIVLDRTLSAQEKTSMERRPMKPHKKHHFAPWVTVKVRGINLLLEPGDMLSYCTRCRIEVKVAKGRGTPFFRIGDKWVRKRPACPGQTRAE